MKQSERQKQWSEATQELRRAAAYLRAALEKWPVAGLPTLRSYLESISLPTLMHAQVETEWLVTHLEVADEEHGDLLDLNEDPRGQK